MREDFKNKLFDTAINKAADLRFKITPDTKDELKKFIDMGVDKMTYSEYQSTFERERAERNLKIFIDKMVDNAKQRGLYESLDYGSFSSVKSIICPLWPFC